MYWFSQLQDSWQSLWPVVGLAATMVRRVVRTPIPRIRGVMASITTPQIQGRTMVLTCLLMTLVLVMMLVMTGVTPALTLVILVLTLVILVLTLVILVQITVLTMEIQPALIVEAI